ncbi:hypothetical protein [Streptomyces lydicus]
MRTFAPVTFSLAAATSFGALQRSFVLKVPAAGLPMGANEFAQQHPAT